MMEPKEWIKDQKDIKVISTDENLRFRKRMQYWWLLLKKKIIYCF